VICALAGVARSVNVGRLAVRAARLAYAAALTLPRTASSVRGIRARHTQFAMWALIVIGLRFGRSRAVERPSVRQ
jgi:hypothetical protein